METRKSEASKRLIDDTHKIYSSVLSRSLDKRQLARPSFTFIHNLIKSLIAETRILRDVYTPADFNTKRQFDRKMKCDFIQKLIDYSAKNGYPTAGCIASKVVAELEPNKTLELLQSLVKIAQQKLSANDDQRPRTFARPLGSASQVRRDSSGGRAAVSQQQMRSRQPVTNTNKETRPPSSTARDKRGPSKVIADTRTFDTNDTSTRKNSAREIESRDTEPRASITEQIVSEKVESIAPKVRSPPVNQPVAAPSNQSNLSSSRRLSSKPGPQFQFDENDLARSLHRLKANLRSLKTNLGEILDQECKLRGALVANII